MFSSRRGRPSLIGRAAHTAARTALITKTATAVAGRSPPPRPRPQRPQRPWSRLPRPPASATRPLPG